MIKKTLSKGVAYLKRNGFRGFCRRLVRKAILGKPVNYKKWLKKRQVTKEELLRQKQHVFESPVTFGICILADNEKKDFIQRTFRSLKEQSCERYTVWKNGERQSVPPDYLLFLKAGVTLEADALYQFAKCLEKEAGTDFLYGDYDFFEMNGNGTENPQCTPEFDLYYLRSRNYIGNLFVCSRELAQKAGLEQALEAGEGIYALLLRCAERAEKIVRVSGILSHQYEESSDHEKDSAALEQHYRRMGIKGKVRTAAGTNSYYTEFMYEKQPLLSIIIPNKDYPEQLEVCVKSILEKGGYDNMEILIAENNSESEETFACYKRLQKLDSRIRIINWKGKFHYSRINNHAVQEAKGEYLLFLNNDTKIKSNDCLQTLMNVGLQSDVGAVGARLYYADETIQHAGVVLGFGGVAGHALEGMDQKRYAVYPFAFSVRQVSAVTAACMLVKREVFQQAEGFSEELAVAYNDIDLCMKIRKAGWKILYCPQAELYHYESQTRGLEMTREKAQRVLREQTIFQNHWKKELEDGDPFYSPNLTLEKSDFSLKR